MKIIARHSKNHFSLDGKLVFEKGGADGEGSGDETIGAISWTDINGKPTIQLTETIVFNNSLNSTDQDTNDEEYIYKWSDAYNPVDMTLSNDGTTLIANKKGTYHINPFIRITDAKANLRSSFYLELDVIGTDGNVVYVLKSSASFIQDDNNAIDKFSVANDFSVVLDVDQKIRLRSIRLFSQDRIDTNYANMNLSTLLIRRIDYTLQ